MSVALHAVAAVMVLWGRSDPAKPSQPAEPAPVEIEFLPAPSAQAAAGAGPAVRPVGEPPPRAAIQDHAHAPRGEPTLPSSSATAAAPSRALAMRAAVDLRVHGLHDGPEVRSAPAVERPSEPTAPLARPAAPDSGEPDPRQTHEGFSLDSEPDGTAHLSDTRNLRWVLGIPTKADVRKRIDAWQDELAQAYSGETKDYCANPERPIEHPIGSIGATVMKFDVTDWMMRNHGQDPYASAKLAQLDATRGERMQEGARYRHAELTRAGQLMERNLEQLWATAADVAERKRELFALWDECNETGTNDVVEASAHARERVVKFVRERLPQGSHEAFTSAELAALNRDKQSRASFAPYADGIE